MLNCLKRADKNIVKLEATMSIHRIEYKHSGAWRLVRDGKSKYFSDVKYGGKEEALQVAKGIEKAMSPEFTRSAFKIETHPELFAQVRGKSGVVGVYCSIQHISNKDYYSWIARKSSGKNKKSRKFSVGKYGPLALQMAIETQQTWDAEQKEKDDEKACKKNGSEHTAN